MESIETYSQILLFIFMFIIVWISFDAYIIDTAIERTMLHRNKIKYIYAKVISMNIMEIRSFLDNTKQNQGIIKINENTQSVFIIFEQYEFEFAIDNNNYECYISINSRRLDINETWDNYNNPFTLEYFYDILIHHKFDTLILEDIHREKFGLFLPHLN